MKRKTRLSLRISSAILLCMSASMLVTSCNGGGETVVVDDAVVTLTFDATQGNVEASAAKGKEGDQVTLTVTPNAGYIIKTVTANGTTLEGPTYSFKLVKGNNSVNVTFEKIDYKVIVTGAKNGVVGEKIQLRAEVVGDETNSVTWKVDNDLYATVDQTGLVTLGAKGTISVTATSKLDPTKSSSPVQIQIYANNTVTKSLEIVNLPTKRKYKVGEQADFSGIEVMGYDYLAGTKDYTSGKVFAKSDLTFSVTEGTTLATAGTQTVTVSVNGYEATQFSITVGDAIIEEKLYVTKYPNKTKYVLKEGERVNFETAGLVISKQTYEDGVLISTKAATLNTDYKLSLDNNAELKYEGTTTIQVYPVDSNVEGTSFNIICYTQDLTLYNLMNQLQTTHNYQAEVLNNVGTTRDTTGFHYLRTYTENYYDEITYKNVSGTNGIEFNTDIELEHIGYTSFEDGDTTGVCEYKVDEIGDVVGSTIVSTSTTNWWDFADLVSKSFNKFNLNLLPTETLNGKYLVINVEQVANDDEDGSQTLAKYPLCEQFLSYCGWSSSLITIMSRFVISITNDYNLSMKAYFGSYGTTEMRINALGNASVRAVERALRNGITPSYTAPEEMVFMKEALSENNYTSAEYGGTTAQAYFTENYTYHVSSKKGYCKLDDGKLYNFTQAGGAFKLGDVIDTEIDNVPEYLNSLGNIGATNSYVTYSLKNMLGTNGGTSALFLFSKYAGYSSTDKVAYQTYSSDVQNMIYSYINEQAATAPSGYTGMLFLNFETGKTHSVNTLEGVDFWIIKDGRGSVESAINIGKTSVPWIEAGIEAANAAL